jgi:hypothetical protein
MAAEGIVTTDDTVFAAMIEASSPPIRALATGARALIFDVRPATVEVVWPRQRTAGYGVGPRKMTEQFCWLAPAAKHLVFGFYYGAELPDPAGLLSGTGVRMRHVKVRSAADLAGPALRALVEAAVADLVSR